MLTRPLPTDLAPYYPDEYHAYQLARNSPIELLRQWAAAKIVYRPISQRKPGVLLDVGCGVGQLASAFTRRGWDAHGVEPSLQASQLAEQRGITIEGRSLDSVSGRFDAIIFNHSLEHIPEPGETLRKARSLLTSDGLVGVAVPNFGSWQRRVFGASWLQLDMPRHVNHFERSTLHDLLLSADLEPVWSLRTPFLPTLTASLGISLPGRAQRLLNYALFPPQLLLPGDCLNIVAKAR